MNQTPRFTALALVAALGVGMVSLPITARASEEGKRNTAIALGAAAVGLLLTQKNKVPGIVAGVGAAYAYKKYDDSVRDRHRREQRYGYNDDYRRDRDNHDYDRNRDRDWKDNDYRDHRDDRFDGHKNRDYRDNSSWRKDDDDNYRNDRNRRDRKDYRRDRNGRYDARNNNDENCLREGQLRERQARADYRDDRAARRNDNDRAPFYKRSR
jgi:hypothetical protein